MCERHDGRGTVAAISCNVPGRQLCLDRSARNVKHLAGGFVRVADDHFKAEQGQAAFLPDSARSHQRARSPRPKRAVVGKEALARAGVDVAHKRVVAFKRRLQLAQVLPAIRRGGKAPHQHLQNAAAGQRDMPTLVDIAVAYDAGSLFKLLLGQAL